jgi:transaldolase
MRIKLFADGADIPTIRRLSENPRIAGFTTNPSLMRKAGIADYKSFAKDVLAVVGARPASFEVLADDFEEMERQALEIASWGPSARVKVPITNTKGHFSGPLIERLSRAGVQVNVTAVTTVGQVRRLVPHLAPGVPSNVSIFAGRIADTGRDPVPTIVESLKVLAERPKAEIIWASTRELLNIVQADAVGCHIITVTADILERLNLVGKDLDAYSLETVQMFYRDAQAAAYDLETEASPEPRK